MTSNTKPSQTLSFPPSNPPKKDMIWIPGGTFQMGSNSRKYPEEGPIHTVTVSGFWMDKYLVTNKQFQKFVKETGYITFAEKVPKAEDYPNADPEMLVPGSAVFIKPDRPVDPRTLCWWQYVEGANWRHPEGKGSSITNRENHPVVHIVYEDALAYAKWAGKELPTEAQWEFAARGGLEGAEFAWGDELMPNGKLMANTWKGEFPWQNLKSQPPGAEAVGNYPPNGYGLYDMIGNVWEWTQDWYREQHPKNPAKACCNPKNPRGGKEEDSYDIKLHPSMRKPRKVLKGGSFLCAPNYCARYRPAGRHPEDIDTSTNHIGFRTIFLLSLREE
ncbi:MAG: formylglycine-generating enzyme family protein [Scytonema sp. PMC 1069.18]|nr:formylglycine-generating enzyme family protein [Scytonema sp. PMC 1069.18]MEC4885859.1 formylglycine-generating enzyme family protein [Scytonema sp. PMC 1070.18]